MKLSIVIITFNEEANIARTLKSIVPLVADGNGEIILVDSGSTDRTCEIARGFGAKVCIEEWKGFAAQKNSAIAKATGEWILSLDADEEVSEELAQTLSELLFESLPNFEKAREQDDVAPHSCTNEPDLDLWQDDLSWQFHSDVPDKILGAYISRKNLFLGRWIKRGGFYPDSKLRLFRKGAGRFEHRIVHETVKVTGPTGKLRGDLIHHAYPTLSGYIEHMNRYSSLGAEMAMQKGQTSRSVFAFVWNVFLRPRLTFFYNYILRLGFLDGREGLLLHLYHSAYVSWKYAKAWEKANLPRRHGDPKQ